MLRFIMASSTSKHGVDKSDKRTSDIGTSCILGLGDNIGDSSWNHEEVSFKNTY